MLFSRRKRIDICPKTQKTTNPPKYGLGTLLKLFGPITGLLALAWFLIRVIPKPSRATYPCQRVAFPLASSFIIWLMGIAASAAAYHKAKRSFVRARYVTAAICVAASVAFIWTALSSDRQQPVSAHEPIVNNAPMGVAKGVHPGRVAWIWDPNATNWSGSTTAPFYFENVCTDQQVVNAMFSKSLRALTGEVTDSKAWDSIFRNFNQQMGRGNVGYTPGEKIAIKINLVLMLNGATGDSMNSGSYDNIGNSPQLTIALLRQLIDLAGVEPNCISIGDPQNTMPSIFYNVVGPNCPGVVYLTKAGTSYTGRTNVVADNDANFYWSDPCAAHWSGVTNTDKIPTHFSQATYLIDFAVLKSHNSGGVTLGGKNHYGSLMRAPNASGYYNMHHSRPYNSDSSPFSSPGMGRYRANVDLLGHPKLGGKTILTLIDGLYGGRSWDSQNTKWFKQPFNSDWPSSIFLSQDPIAIDSVCFDFMDNEWNGTAGTLNGYPQYSGTDDYLHEAALIPDPCSGTNYDPNHDGGITESLGTHEHWNNATDKKYSRNLGTGNGIELVQYAPGWPDISGDRLVNFEDFAIMANAWRTTIGNPNYDTNSDISSTPGDGIIDEKDLAVLAENWLADFSDELVRPGALPQQIYSASGVDFEGPTWDPASHKLFLSARTGTWQTYRLDGSTMYSWLNPSPHTNGMIMSNDGRLLCCDESTYQITSRGIGPSGPTDTIVLATGGSGSGIFTKPPNDLCQLVNGNIYFTTPIWDSSAPSSQGVWLLEPNAAVRQVDGTLYQPNGIITSLDETKLYVSAGSTTTSRQKWQVFNIDPNGNLSNATVFFNPSGGNRANVPDGITIDEMGNLYFAGLGGVSIVSPSGTLLRFISTPVGILNVAFGGTDGRTLFMTGNGKIYTLQMAVRGGEATSW